MTLFNITLENGNKTGEANVDGSIRAWDFSVPWTAGSLPAESGSISFGSGVTADYALGVQTGIEARMIHIRNLSTDLAPGESVTGTTTAGSTGMPQFTSGDQGINLIGGATHNDQKPYLKIYTKTSASGAATNADLTFTRWDQIESGDYRHVWRARGRTTPGSSNSGGFFAEMHFYFWPSSNRMDWDLYLCLSDETLDLPGYYDIQPIMFFPSAEEWTIWWEAARNGGGVLVDQNLSIPVGYGVKVLHGEVDRFAHSNGMTWCGSTALASATSDEKADIASAAVRPFAQWGMASRSDWEGKFGPPEKFVDWTPREGGVFETYNREVKTVDEMVAGVVQRFDSHIAAAERNGWSMFYTYGQFGLQDKPNQTGEQPGFGSRNDTHFFPQVKGQTQRPNILHIQQAVLDALHYRCRPINFRERGPDDPGASGMTGDMVTFESYPWTGSGGAASYKSDFALASQEFYSASRYKFGQSNITAWAPFAVVGRRERLRGAKGSHFESTQFPLTWLLTGRYIILELVRTQAETFRLMSPTHDYYQFINKPIEPRGYRTLNSAVWCYYGLPGSTERANLLQRINDIARKPDEIPSGNDEDSWWREMYEYKDSPNSYAFYAWGLGSGTGNSRDGPRQYPYWDCWTQNVSYAGLWWAYKLTGNSQYLDRMYDTMIMQFDHGYYEGDVGYRPNLKWHHVYYIWYPGFTKSGRTTPGTRGEAPPSTWYTDRGKCALGGNAHTWYLGALQAMKFVFSAKGDNARAVKADEALKQYALPAVNAAGVFEKGITGRDVEVGYEDWFLEPIGGSTQPPDIEYQTTLEPATSLIMTSKDPTIEYEGDQGGGKNRPRPGFLRGVGRLRFLPHFRAGR